MEPSEAPIALDRDVFMRSLIRELARVLEDVVGLEEAAGYVSLVSQTIGVDLNHQYAKALAVDRLDRGQVAQVMVDFKRRIGGGFYVLEESDQRIVLGNRVCPFGEKVVGRPSMCMMTSNVFGTLAAENLGYARVELEKTIARWDVGCRVVVHLRPPSETEASTGREYYGDLP
ncbi:transcriptional regulator [Streptomyces venezuelae]|uniref:Transcriptional regulator n=1 Tax=Streptomyces venezuelae TaxID=54571 RepID=A0A5P2BV92_STRVZ|nr:methanogen output domain 1-containing protein [Streptomyces venezuelae]QES32339.1 transcriptional regulator [Streptomyces venezuelae]